MISGPSGRIFLVRMEENDDLLETIAESARQSAVNAGIFTLVGALKRAVLGCYDNGRYKCTHLNGPLEIASCMGNVARDEKGDVVIHAHLVVSSASAKAYGGHLMKGSCVGPTAELMMTEVKVADLQRVFDEKTKLKLLKLG